MRSAQAASVLSVSISSGGTDNTQQAQFDFVVKNTSAAAQSNISVRIYFTPDGSEAATSYVFERYYDSSGAATVSGPTLLSGTTYYFTVSYGTATLGAGATWQFNTSIHLVDWSNNVNSANDYYHTGYAVGSLPSSFTATNSITAYISGTLNWGTEPGGAGTTAPTNTFTPTKGNTSVPTNTPTRTNTATSGPTSTRTNTPTRTNTATTGPTPTHTNTPTTAPTSTLTPTFAATTPVSTATVGPSGTPETVPFNPTTPLNVSIGNPVTGNATWFSALGAPYGGCGITQSQLDTQNFLALNVQNTPGDYSTFLTRPILAANASKIGMWDNGYNCGRWVKVTIGNYCTGTNDGAQNMPFCHGGSWITDAYNGATLDMIVADSCQDSNAWCRDDPYHVDLAQASLNTFVLNGQPVGNMDPAHWNNRQVSWQFEAAPNYTGDIKIGMIQSSQLWWTPIAITHLANGIHGVDYFQNGVWVQATMDADLGEDYLIEGTTGQGSSTYQIVWDSNNQLINNGRLYDFSFPTACGSSCSGPYTPVTYTTQ